MRRGRDSLGANRWDVWCLNSMILCAIILLRGDSDVTRGFITPNQDMRLHGDLAMKDALSDLCFRSLGHRL